MEALSRVGFISGITRVLSFHVLAKYLRTRVRGYRSVLRPSILFLLRLFSSPFRLPIKGFWITLIVSLFRWSAETLQG